MRVLVVYDISDDNTRVKVARILETWGLSRIQRSAFTGVMLRSRALDLARRLEAMVDIDTDIIHIVFLQPQDWAKTIVLGKPVWVRGELNAIHIL